MQTITKEKIATQIENQLGLSGVICEELVSKIFTCAADIILQDQTLKIKNFGSFAVVQKNERTGRDMQTGAKVLIPPRAVIKFNPSRNFKKRLNGDG